MLLVAMVDDLGKGIDVVVGDDTEVLSQRGAGEDVEEVDEGGRGSEAEGSGVCE